MHQRKRKERVGGRRLGWILLAGVLFLGLSLPPVSFHASQSRSLDKSPTIADLAWISGSWQTASGPMRVEEHWTEAASNAILGVGRTLAGDKMVFFEYLRIEARPEGIYYVAHPEARPGTDFKLTSFDGRHAVFENPEHDFPKRISYRRNPDGSLTARVDGGAGVEKGAEEFHYQPLKK